MYTEQDLESSLALDLDSGSPQDDSIAHVPGRLRTTTNRSKYGVRRDTSIIATITLLRLAILAGVGESSRSDMVRVYIRP